MSNAVGARQVGEFFSRDPRQTIKQMKNPVDVTTIVSVFPKTIEERKHTIEPGYFRIPAGDPAAPNRLVVGSSSWWRDVGVDQPILEIPVGSLQVAHSVITDYCNGLVGCNMADLMPGLFFIPGDVPVDVIKRDYKESIEAVAIKQHNWFQVLINMAGSLWARSGGNPLVVADEMRVAARMLGRENEPWMLNYTLVRQVPCFACGTMKDPKFPVCKECRAVDPEHPLASQIKFAT